MAKVQKSKFVSLAVENGMKPVRHKLNQSELANHIAEHLEMPPKEVKAVLSCLKETIAMSMHPKGGGEFMLHGVVKMVRRKTPARPKRRGRNPSTGEEMWFKAKPAGVKVAARPMKEIKLAINGN